MLNGNNNSIIVIVCTGKLYKRTYERVDDTARTDKKLGFFFFNAKRIFITRPDDVGEHFRKK